MLSPKCLSCSQALSCLGNPPDLIKASKCQNKASSSFPLEVALQTLTANADAGLKPASASSTGVKHQPLGHLPRAAAHSNPYCCLEQQHLSTTAQSKARGAHHSSHHLCRAHAGPAAWDQYRKSLGHFLSASTCSSCSSEGLWPSS